MRRPLVVLIVVLSSIAFGAPCVAGQSKTVSGLAVGEMTPSFPVLAVTGPHKGKEVCYVCQFIGAPTIFAFFRQTGEDMASVVKELNELARRNKDIRVVAIIIEGQESLGCLKWLLAVDRFLDSRCQSRLSSAWWRSIFNEQRFIQAHQLRATGICINI